MKIRHSSVRRSLAAVAAVAALSAATATAWLPEARAQGKPLEKVSVRYGFVGSGLDAIWTYGTEKGFFREQGIELELREGKGSAVTAQTVATGADDFGVDIDGGTFLTLAAKGLPATAIMAIASKSPLVVLSPESAPIRSPKDLEGKTVAITAGDGPSALMPALFERNGIDAKKVSQINMQAGPKLTSLLTGNVQSVATNVVVQGRLNTQGMKTHAMMYADFGVVTPGMYLITSNANIEKRPELVKRFVTAALKSMDALEKDPVAAAESFVKVTPGYDRQVALNEVNLLVPLLRSADTQGKPLGTISLADAKSGAELLQKYGSLPAGADVSQYVTNRFAAR